MPTLKRFRIDAKNFWVTLHWILSIWNLLSAARSSLFSECKDTSITIDKASFLHWMNLQFAKKCRLNFELLMIKLICLSNSQLFSHQSLPENFMLLSIKRSFLRLFCEDAPYLLQNSQVWHFFKGVCYKSSIVIVSRKMDS